MSQLAFDKEGQPFELSPQTESLWVRRFRNPGARGTCEVLYDDDDELLHVDADATLADLRLAVGQVPGLYRLDQCDETGAAIDKAPAAYATIDPPRNGMFAGGAAEPLAIVRDMAAINADVSKTLADRAAGMMEAMAGCMRDMRTALDGDPGRRLLSLMTKVASESAPKDEDQDDDRDEDDEDSETEDAPADPLASLGPFAPMVAAMAPKIGEAIAAKVVELMTQLSKKSPPVAASTATAAHVPAPAPAPAPHGSAPQDAAAGSGPVGTPPTPPAPAHAPNPPSVSPPGASTPASSASPVTTAVAPTVPSAETGLVATAGAATPSEAAVPSSSAEMRNAAPTAEQLAHLLAVRAALNPREVAIVDGVIARMDGATAAQWIAELCALTVDQAVARVRVLIPKPTAKQARSEP